MIEIKFVPVGADADRSAAFIVTANGQALGTVEQWGGSGWRAVAERGRVMDGLFMQRIDAADALVDDSGILDR